MACTLVNVSQCLSYRNLHMSCTNRVFIKYFKPMGPVYFIF
ncbi:hypothetical protein SXCC_01398 [Gluconacetobacter sp. SXCC-1]|nr:hypothetical protein SXCC_01398 [Gluconacetobacter sp. SXCC-1]